MVDPNTVSNRIEITLRVHLTSSADLASDGLRHKGPSYFRMMTSPVNPKDHATAMTTNFYLQHSQNRGIHTKSPLSKPAYGDSECDDSDSLSDMDELVAAGRRDPEVYERILQSWRVAMRRPIVRIVEKESHIIAAMQVLRPPCPVYIRHANQVRLLLDV